MIDFANAKINIGLYITEKRKDGYHNIETVFYPIGLEDVMEILPSRQFELTETGLATGVSYHKNLVYKAYEMLKEDYGISPVKVYLHKNIPSGAGLGGGSSDAARMLVMLNNLFELGLSKNCLKNYARRLGADCAFFIDNKPVLAKEKGDVFEKIDLDLSQYRFVVVKPGFSVSTPEAYSLVKPQKHNVSLKNAVKKDITKWKDLVVNDFEEFLFPKYPYLKQIKDFLYDKGALYASMTGSGSALFGIYPGDYDNFDDFDFDFFWAQPLK